MSSNSSSSLLAHPSQATLSVESSSRQESQKKIIKGIEARPHKKW
jgi:hypothetical protein